MCSPHTTPSGADCRNGLLFTSTLHDLRHHAPSKLLARCVPVATLAKMLGHSVAVLLDTYEHASRSDTEVARDAVERVWSHDRVMSVSRTGLSAL